ncbi:uncharacterized protein N7484_008245 [Penicillium longicatenatum]|uniref:uncharacterized protein n=1 Tax=Penicillium longicatenatum TaxID=1561947 RepID=UPI002548A46C|nr:uncharacterized protein N7484_008245 [Penicillium longicatenatum]KAJ5634932.1 hypothetical protein N7484_008245 [Penicillium longicatenatum]
MTLRNELGPLDNKVVALIMTLIMTEISTNLMSPNSISFDLKSIFTAALEGAKERSRNYANNSMKPEAFAKQLVQAILAKVEKREFLWKGINAWVIWFLNLVGWSNMLDSVVKRMIGFEIKKPDSTLEKVTKL